MRYVLIVIGCILGAALLLILLLLFAPFRYRLTGEYDKEPTGQAWIRWLFPVLSIKVLYSDGKPEVTARILGIRINTDRLLKKADGKPKKQDTKKEKKRKEKLPWREQLRVLYNEFEAVKKLVRKDSTRRGTEFLLSNAVRLTRSIRPRKVRITAVIGTGDAYSLGNVLIGLSILYGLYGDSLDITPDWENEILQVKGMMKGRIILFTLIVICIKVIMNKDIKRIKHGLEKIVKAGQTDAAA